MLDGPERADRLSIHVPGGEQALVDARLDASHVWEEPLCLVEQEHSVAVHHDPAGARLLRYCSAEVGGEGSDSCLPAEDAAGVARFKDAHPSRVSVAQLHD